MVDKESCTKMAVYRRTNTEIRCCRKLTSLDSTVLREILLPISFNGRIENSKGLNFNRLLLLLLLLLFLLLDPR